MNETYSKNWTFSFQKVYVLDFNKRTQKYGGLTICSSYKGMCKHVATYHKAAITAGTTTKRRTFTDYLGLFVDISVYLNRSIWTVKLVGFYTQLIMQRQRRVICFANLKANSVV
jgi:hypothetical protein